MANRTGKTTMARYFFDVINESGRSHDYQGCDFPTPDGAKRQGELIALDLQLEQENEGHVTGKVSVCDAMGRELFSIPVQSQTV
jgi:hypothetical protein